MGAEMIQGYENNQEFHDILALMDMHREDIEQLFNIMDKDESGDVSYEEFANELQHMQTQGLQAQMSFVKHWVQDVKTDVKRLVQATCPYQTNSLGSPRRRSVGPGTSVRTDHHPAEMRTEQPSQHSLTPTIDALRQSMSDQFHELQRALERQTKLLVRDEHGHVADRTRASFGSGRAFDFKDDGNDAEMIGQVEIATNRLPVDGMQRHGLLKQAL